MNSTNDAEIPDIAAVLVSVLQRVPWEQRPLLVAIAERLAAERYRGWAMDSSNEAQKEKFLECARREEEIAGLVEALDPNAARVQQEILAKNPDLEDLSHSLFASRPLNQQVAMQAQGERLGAATWRSFAGTDSTLRDRETFLLCAKLEEESAQVLESILRDGI